MLVFLTGGHGFLGKHLLQQLLHAGYRVLAPSRKELELRDRQAVRTFFQKYHPEACIHAAAVGGGIGWMQQHPETAFLGNLLPTAYLLEAAADFRCFLVGVFPS